MIVVFASLMGKTKEFMSKLDKFNSLQITTGNEVVSEPYILVTPTVGSGEVPEIVTSFLEKNKSKKFIGVIGNGNSAIHADTYAGAADIISKKYNVPVLYKFDGSGSDSDLKVVSNLCNFWKLRE